MQGFEYNSRGREYYGTFLFLKLGSKEGLLMELFLIFTYLYFLVLMAFRSFSELALGYEFYAVLRCTCLSELLSLMVCGFFLF